MTTLNRIPLFPLDVVLFPTMPLPLHVFEERYKRMIGRCLQEPCEFGVVMAGKDAIATVGCTARIVRKVKDYPDGRMDILTEGTSVFRLAEFLDEKEYHEGMVEYLADKPSSIDLLQEKELIESFESCHLLLFGTKWGEASGGAASGGDAAYLSYRIACWLPIDLAGKGQCSLDLVFLRWLRSVALWRLLFRRCWRFAFSRHWGDARRW